MISDALVVGPCAFTNFGMNKSTQFLVNNGENPTCGKRKWSVCIPWDADRKSQDLISILLCVPHHADVGALDLEKKTWKY